ncbi:hypothetical protein ACLI1C_15040 [Devosia sp. XGJD_8]|jgi:hypothetical protein|uniref:hypothetical protein n=1 Tax=Devosia sp. XGJD_8 TaxID=3391187 RepID=UPI003984778B
MRAGFALIVGLALCTTPVVAQGKVKAAATPQSVQVLEMCETFAAGDVLAVEAAIAKGWDAYDQESESPFVKSYAGSKDVPGLGYANMFALVESYPQNTFGYCRVDVAEPAGDGQSLIQAIQQLDRYEGEAIQNGDGSFASLTGADGATDRLLLAHWSQEAFVVQLSINTVKAAAAE